MKNIYDPYGFRKLSLPNIQMSVGNEEAFKNGEDLIRFCKKWCKERMIKLSYAFGAIPSDSIFDNPGMKVSIPCEFMTKDEINTLDAKDLLLDTDEIQKQLTNQYNQVRNLVVSDMLQNNLEKITLKKYNYSGNVLYTTNFSTTSKTDALVKKQYILFSKDTHAILDFLNTTTFKSFENAQNSSISNKDFLIGVHQVERRIPNIEKSKAKRKVITFTTKDSRK